jgi:hypothetical protein
MVFNYESYCRINFQGKDSIHAYILADKYIQILNWNIIKFKSPYLVNSMTHFAEECKKFFLTNTAVETNLSFQVHVSY